MDYNILIDALPLTVTVGGREFPISADFRTGILFEILMLDPEVPKQEKFDIAIELFFPDAELKDDALFEEATDQLIWFYTCGADKKKVQRGQGASSAKKRIYDFNEDAPLIYAAYLAQYNIDLQDIEFLHWWKFNAMFTGLSSENEIVKIMEYRSVDLSKIKSKSERQRYASLQAKYRLPDNRTAEQKQADVGAIFGGMAK